MEVRLHPATPEHCKGDVLLAPLCQEAALVEVCPELAQAAPWLSHSPALNDVTGKKNEQVLLYGPTDAPVARVLAVGLGPRDALDVDAFRDAVAAAVGFCRTRGYASLLLPLSLLAHLPGGRERLTEESVVAALLAIHRVASLKKPDPDEPPAPQSLTLVLAPTDLPESFTVAAERGQRAAQAVAYARDLAATPPNLLSPALLAEQAQLLAKEKGFLCTVLDADALRAAHMGCLLAVGQGSARPPCLVVLEYAPQGHSQDRPLVLVGKGITFDSGGICLKPAANMHQMKADMTGAAVVLATVAAAAQEGLPHRVVGLLACADNMPDGAAMRPGDVVRAANGDSVEIRNTDAEGRLALCDALVYAQTHFEPQALVDVATLTGACAVALGNGLAGLFCNDDALAEAIQAAGGPSGEHYWRLPLWKPYAEALKSDVADICHMGPREGGAINAALFLQHFLKEGLPWAHLDIAGVDWAAKASALTPEGPTAFGTRTLINLARRGRTCR